MSGHQADEVPPSVYDAEPEAQGGRGNGAGPQLSAATALIEMNAHRLVRGSSVLDSPECVESVWGDGHQSLWAKQEPLLVCGPDAVGKTTLMQQATLGLVGLGPTSLLGFTLHQRQRRVLYLACDRPAQAARSFRRMLTEDQRRELDERLAIWRGPLPTDLATEPDGLLVLARKANCEIVVVDSLKDVAADLSKEETGIGVNRALQLCCTEGVDVLAGHHQRKQQAGAGKPRHLSDVYGSRWIPAGCGSVVLLWGELDSFGLEVQAEPLGRDEADLAAAISIAERVAKGTTVALPRLRRG